MTSSTLLIFFDSFFVLVKASVAASHLHMSLPPIRIEGNAFLRILQRTLEFVEVKISCTAITVQFGVVAIQFDCLAI